MDFQIEVNNKHIKVKEGETLLTALRGHGIRIPTLCHMNRFSPTGACRLCVVEVEGKRDLITSCSFPVEDGMKVKTNSRRVIQARKALVELLLSNHPDDCLYCVRNGHCELQWLAESMNIKERKYFGNKNTHYPDYSSTSVARDPAKCILCSRCVRICEEVQLVTAIDFISRGNQTMVNSAFNKGLNVSSCIHCGQCIQVCPTAALTDISHQEKVLAALDKKDVRVMFMISPSVAASIADILGLKIKDNPLELICGALRRCGADKVFHLGAASDINIREEASNLVRSIQNAGNGMPLLSSCCPAWVRYVEEFRPEWITSLSKTKSPQQIMGALIKTNYANQNGIPVEQVYNVAVMPCVGKKYEASREENTHKGISETDAVLTVRELLQLLRSCGLDITNTEGELLDKPFDQSSGAAWKMGFSGGKAEAVAREAFLMMGGKPDAFKFNAPKNISGRKETKIQIGGKQVGFAWVSSISDAEEYLQQLSEDGREDIHYVEIMACLSGCAGGGGQPISRGFEQVIARKKLCMEMEKNCDVSDPKDNPALKAFFGDDQFLSEDDEVKNWLRTDFKERRVVK